MKGLEEQDKNRRIAKNTLMLYFRMILSMLVSLYTSRVVLNVLGVDDFGTYNVVGGVVALFGFFNGAMGAATQRFLSYDLGKKDYVQLRKTFNATQVVHIGIALLVLLLAETVGLWFVNHKLVVPDGRMEAARWVYQCAVFTFMINIIQVPYNSILIARERMNVYAYMSILEVGLKLLIVFVLTWVAYDKLKLYGLLLLGVALVVATLYRIYTRRHFDETRFEVVRDKKLFRTLVSYSGWNLFGGVAAISKAQGVSILLNLFFGTVVNAAQGVANQVSGAISLFVTNFQMASNPQIIQSYAAEDKAYMNRLVLRTSKFSFYLLFLLMLPVLLEVDYILKLWLQLVPEFSALFTVLVLVNALIDTVSGPLMTALQATGRIRAYQTLVGLLLILILPISYGFFKAGFAPHSTFVVGIAVSVLALACRLWLTKRQIPEFDLAGFVREILLRNLVVVLLALVAPLLLRLYLPVGFLRLVVVTATALASAGSVIYFLGLNAGEKQFVGHAARSFIQKLKP